MDDHSITADLTAEVAELTGHVRGMAQQVDTYARYADDMDGLTTDDRDDLLRQVQYARHLLDMVEAVASRIG